MKLRSILGTLFILGITISSSIGQKAFHRLYPTISEFSANTVSDAIQRKNGLYATVEFMLTPDPTGQNITCDTLIFSEFKPKGDVQSSLRVFIDPKIYGGVDTGTKATMVEGADGAIYIAFNTFKGDDGRKQLLTFSLVNGQPMAVITSYKNLQTELDSIQQFNLLEKLNKNLLNISSTGDTLESNVVFSKKALQLSPAATDFVKILAAKDDMGGDVEELLGGMSVDAKLNRIATVGTVDSVSSQSFLLVTDTTGNIIMSKKFTDIESLFSASLPTNVLITKDTGYVISGNAVILSASGITITGYLMRVDKRGDVIWTKHVKRDPMGFSIVKSMTFNQSSDIVLTLADISTSTGEASHYAVEVDILGNEKDKKAFPRIPGNFDFFGKIFPAATGGTAWFTNCVKDDKPVTSFLKLDDKLSTTCEEEVSELLLTDIEYIADTLLWTSTNGAVYTKVNTQKLEANLYNVPFVSLEVRPFCPNEPINWLFETPIDGATFYEWSTGVKGPLLDTLRVFEEGKFSVTVTVDKDVCFMLCDTSEIERISKPTASIGVELGNWCTNGKLTLNSVFNPGAAIKNYVWSTGETNTQSIEVSSPGTYSITYTDACNEQAVGTVSTGSFPVNISNVILTPKVTVNCNTGKFTGTIEAKGNSSDLGEDKYLWSIGGVTSGVKSKIITIDQDTPSIVSVTVTDFCGKTATASYELKLLGPNEIKPSIIVDKPNFCTNGTVRLNTFIETGAGKYKYKWSTNDSLPFIETKVPGNYTVTVTDLCGNTATASQMVLRLPENITAAMLVPDIKVNCNTGRFTGTITANGNSFDLGVERFQWTGGSGGTNNVVTINQNFPSAISVTVTDFCGKTASASYALDLKGDKNIGNGFYVDKSKLCTTGLVRLNTVQDTSYRLAYKWSTGDVTPFIETKTPGLYSLTITDLCKNTSLAEYKLTVDDISPENLQYAKVFFPDGIGTIEMPEPTDTLGQKQIDALVLNRTFGPMIGSKTCAESITDYEFYVFNRWGQQVFESSKISDEWDGTKDGADRHLSDTYLWVVRYNVLGIEKTLKGDINMIR